MNALLSYMPAIVENCDVADLMRPEKQLIKTLVRIVHSGTTRCKLQALDLLAALVVVAEPAAVNSAMGTSEALLGSSPYTYLVIALAKACTLQVQVPGQPVLPITMAAAFASQPLTVPTWFHGPPVSVAVATKIAVILKKFGAADETAHIYSVVQGEARERIGALAVLESDLAGVGVGGSGAGQLLAASPIFWLAVGSLCVVDERTIAAIAGAAEVQRSGTILMCSNHADGVTEAVVSCEVCALHFCDECDHVIHLPRSKRSHARNQVAKKGAEIILGRDATSTTASTQHMLLSCEVGSTFNGMLNVQTGAPLSA